MSLDLSAPTESPAIRTVSLSSTAGNVTKILLPPTGSWKISFYARSSSAKLGAGSLGLDDDAAIGASAYATLPADAWSELTLYPLGPAISETRALYLAGSSSAVVEVLLERLTVIR